MTLFGDTCDVMCDIKHVIWAAKIEKYSNSIESMKITLNNLCICWYIQLKFSEFVVVTIPTKKQDNSLPNLTLCHEIVSWRRNVMASVTLVSITGSSADKSMVVFLFLTYFWSPKSYQHESILWHSRVSLYVKVTWPWRWLILSLVLVQISWWVFYCFQLTFGQPSHININKWSWLISGFRADESMIFCCRLTYFLVTVSYRSHLNIIQHSDIHAWPCTSR